MTTQPTNTNANANADTNPDTNPPAAAAAAASTPAIGAAQAEALPEVRAHGGLSAEWTARYGGALMNTFGPPKRVFVRGEGAYLWDADGRRYLDLFAGIAVNALGHGHPLIVNAVTAQLTTLGHVGNFFATTPQVALAERLVSLAGSDARVYFANSGTEANEAAFKLARLTGRTKIVSTVGGFHGRTMGALALTGKPAIREPFEPLPAGVEFVPFGDIGALEAAIDDETAAFFVEPIQGEAGVLPAPPGYLRAARELTERHGALLVLDEVQTGVGRTGEWFAFQHDDVRPDVLTLAKGLGGGLPIGACLAFGPAKELFVPGSHGSTFGGNPVACAAGLAVLYAIERDGLLARTREVGARLREGIEALGHPAVAGVRGMGLLLAIRLRADRAAAVSDAALDAGFIVNAVNPQAVRIAPPLILTADQADEFLAALPKLLDHALEAAG
jgi:acetylornithine/N-succinyldiaminopimelate aminotransferase